jgi:hypothetical protein
MARKRMLNTIRTDYLESKIAHYDAMRWYDAAEALRSLAREIGAPIDDDAIAEDARKRRIYYETGQWPGKDD